MKRSELINLKKLEDLINQAEARLRNLKATTKSAQVKQLYGDICPNENEFAIAEHMNGEAIRFVEERIDYLEGLLNTYSTGSLDQVPGISENLPF